MNPKLLNKTVLKIETVVDKIQADVQEIKLVQESQGVDLKHHIKRTDDLQNIVEPLHEKYHQLVGAIKILTTLTALISLFQAAKWLFHLF